MSALLFILLVTENETCLSHSELIFAQQLNCSLGCLERRDIGDSNITDSCASKCPASLNTCIQEMCMSLSNAFRCKNGTSLSCMQIRKECRAIHIKICNESDLESDIDAASVCFQQCDPDSNDTLPSSMCVDINIMHCRRNSSEALSCARRCRTRRNCVSICVRIS